MSKEIETAVANYLQSKGIKTVIAGGIETENNGWKCDQWSVMMTRSGKKEALTETYYTGVGHRKKDRFGNVKAVTPPIAGVLYSLLRDCDCAESNFHDWCDEMGYDKDSISHLNIYNACCAILSKMRVFFTKEEREELNKMLEDY